MGRAVLATVGATALLGALPGAAQASCGTSCLQREIKGLQKQVKTLQKQVTSDTKFASELSTCLGEVPVTRYGDGTGHTFGYVYDPGSGQTQFDATALDGTNAGLAVSVWLLSDGCNKTTTAAADVPSIRTAHVVGAFGPIATEYTIPTLALP